MVETETRKKMKCLRTDNGGEYTSEEFRNYCADFDIRHEKTEPVPHNLMVRQKEWIEPLWKESDAQ